ncbi:hypothetical protein [Streptomyces sp. NBC_00878]|uniref:hypothetical protein n=1 Tax=Streptomyces sp. NBC_00878 TaxID=2975854 RepID=UPI0022521449|nr:hypothetical protein [Streptomyces sp. NBC_00878]MCX4905907.1 hypothetical protein [Streptomyces sp. NBC_00878]
MFGRHAWGVRRTRAASARGRRTRAARLVLAVPLLAVALAGCGIRATEVPTDFGPAPSRVPCTLTAPDIGTQSSRGILVQVFLLCSSQLAPVDRTVRIGAGPADTDRVRGAQALLDELSEPPSDAEQQANYTTSVPDGLTVNGPNRGDPDDTLRLSTRPTDLSSYALAQIICTFSDSAAAADGAMVTLGGPGTDTPRRYECTEAVRSRPGTETPPQTETEGT